MRQIELIGPVDKRAIAYPLFKICDTMGKVLVVTDDANFRRFADNYENEFTLGRSDFIVTNDVTQPFIDDIQGKFSSYDYVIIISTKDIIENTDCLVYCHGSSQMVCDETVIDNLENIEHTDVTISAQKPKTKGETFLSIESKGFKYIWDCEENKRFIPCQHPDLVRLNSYLFAQVLGVSKEEYASIIAKDV